MINHPGLDVSPPAGHELVSRDHAGPGKTIARYARVGLLCIDEFGYREPDRYGALRVTAGTFRLR